MMSSPRKNTSPVKMMSRQRETAQTNDGFGLPSLMPCYQGVPRRYEETKPVIVQDFTHRKILDIGMSIHKQREEKADFERQAAMRNAEQAVWKQAEYEKEQALLKAKIFADQEMDKIIKKLNKQHERMLKQEALRVESQMQKLMMEEIEREQEIGKDQLKEAVAMTTKKCRLELEEAVFQAREEKKLAAKVEAEHVAKDEAIKLEQTLQKAEEGKQQALNELSKKLNSEKLEAVEKARQDEIKCRDQMLSDMQKMFEEKLEGMQKHIDTRNDKIERLTNALGQTEAECLRADNSLQNLQSEFQHFIDMTYTEGQADFVLPQFDVVVSKGGMSMSMSRAESRM